MILVNMQRSLTEDEVLFAVSRGSGSGGLHLNTTDARVTLRFDVINSKSLSGRQKARVLAWLAGRINKKGVLRVTAYAEHRQKANKLWSCYARPLKEEKKRRPTQVSLGEKCAAWSLSRQHLAV